MYGSLGLDEFHTFSMEESMPFLSERMLSARLTPVMNWGMRSESDCQFWFLFAEAELYTLRQDVPFTNMFQLTNFNFTNTFQQS